MHGKIDGARKGAAAEPKIPMFKTSRFFDDLATSSRANQLGNALDILSWPSYPSVRVSCAA
jgi:hypothetical protein